MIMDIDSFLAFCSLHPVLPPFFFGFAALCSIPIIIMFVATQRCALHRNCRFLISFWCVSLLGVLVNIVMLNTNTIVYEKGYIPLGIVEPPLRAPFLAVHSMVYASSSCFEMFIAFERILSTHRPDVYHVSKAFWKLLIPLTIFALRNSSKSLKPIYGCYSLGSFIGYFIYIAGHHIMGVVIYNVIDISTLVVFEACEMAKAMHPVYLVSFCLKGFSIVIAYVYFFLMEYFNGSIYALMDFGYFSVYALNCAFASAFLIYLHKSLRKSASTLLFGKKDHIVPVVAVDKSLFMVCLHPLDHNLYSILLTLRYFFTLLSVILSIVTTAVIISCKTQSSKNYSLLLILIVIVTILSDLYLQLIFDPIFFFPVPCITRDNPLIFLPGSSRLHYVIWVFLVILNCPVYLACFGYRHQVVLQPGSRWKFRPLTQFLICLPSFLMCFMFAVILDYTFIPRAPAAEFWQMLSSDWSHELIARADCTDKQRIAVFGAVAVACAIMVAVGGFTVCSHTFSQLRGTQRLSEKTRAHHRILTRVLLLQCSVPVVCVLCPILVSLSSYFLKFDGTSVVPLCMTVISTHSLMHSIALLGTTPMYRQRLRRCVRKSSNITTPTTYSVVHDSQRRKSSFAFRY